MAKRDDSVVVPGGSGLPPTTVRRDPNNPAVLTSDPGSSVFVDPRVSSPQALSYAAGAQERRRGAPLPKYTDPVAGGPDMPIPHLGERAAEGSTMAAQALQQRGNTAPMMPQVADVLKSMGMEPSLNRGSIVEGTSHQQEAPAPRSGGLHAPEGLLPADLLPEQATKDPHFQQGHGAMFAVNQPELAYKYGVVRNKQFVPPQQVRTPPRKPGAGGLSPQSVEGLRALQELESQRSKVESNAVSDKQIEEDAKRGPAGGAADNEKSVLSDHDKKKLLNDLDEFEVSRLKSAVFKDMLNNDKQREIIEARLEPLDLGSLIVNGVVTQVVPINPGKFEPEFQSYMGEEDLVIKRLIGEESGLAASDRYILDKYQLMGLTIALRALNKKLLPSYQDHDGNFDEGMFWAKYKVVSRFNYHMLASLSANWFWFDMRVRKLFRAEELGNG